MANIGIVSKAKSYVKDFFAHWNVPYEGRYIPNKEVAAYGIGGMGVHLATVVISAVGLSASNLLVGSCIGLKPTHLYYMLVIANIIGISFTMFRSYIMDNIKSPMGKFRPFLKWMGLPSVLSACLFVWMPYELMTYNQKAATVLVLYLVINIFSPFYTDSFGMLIQVMSPDSDERTDVMSISQIIYSLAPSITNFAIPFLAGLTGGLTDIRTYRIIYPAISLFGLLLAFPVYKFTNERIIKPKSKENEIRFFDAIRSVAKNKYFWITSVAGWIGFLEMSYYVILQWTFVYAYPEKEKLLGVANTIIGNGALWAMMAAPFLIRKIGKRKLLISCNITNIILLAFLFFTYHNVYLVIAIFYINNFVLVLGNIYNPGIQADMRDYQQYITGERIDGMFGVVGLIGTFLSYFTGSVVPFLQEKCGLKDNYDVLYDASIRDNLFKTMIIASVIGATLNVIPYLFYDLTEKQHRGITYVLRIRAMFDDYSAGCLDDDELVRAMNIITDIKGILGKQPVEISKYELKAARALPKKTPEEKAARSEAIKNAKNKINELKIRNENIELAPFVLAELDKFSTVQFQKQVENAKYIVDNEGTDLNIILQEINAKIASVPKPETKEEKLILSDLKKLAKEIKYAIKTQKKFFASGVYEPDENAIQEAQNLPTDTLKQTIDRKRAVKKAIKDRSNYRHAVKPYTDAKRLLIQQEAYNCMDVLEERYNAIQAQTVTA